MTEAVKFHEQKFIQGMPQCSFYCAVVSSFLLPFLFFQFSDVTQIDLFRSSS